MNRLSTKTAQLVGMGILTALVIVLQTFASGFKIGTFSPPLSLIPIIMGAVLFGELAGAILGLVFGAVVLFAVISGAEPFSTLMLQYNPAFTVVICIFKGLLAGYVSGIVYKLLKGVNNVFATIAASVAAPVVNTGIFSVGMLTVFYPLLARTASTAGAENVILFYFTIFIGVGFIFNLAFIAILVPGLLRIIKIVRK